MSLKKLLESIDALSQESTDFVGKPYKRDELNEVDSEVDESSYLPPNHPWWDLPPAERIKKQQDAAFKRSSDEAEVWHKGLKQAKTDSKDESKLKEASEFSADEMLEQLTHTYQILTRGEGSPGATGHISPDDTSLKTVYDLLRSALMKGDAAEYNKTLRYCSSKYPDATDLLFDDIPGDDLTLAEEIRAAFEDYVSNEKYDADKLYPAKSKKPSVDKKKEKVKKSADPAMVAEASEFTTKETTNEIFSMACQLAREIVEDYQDEVTGKQTVSAPPDTSKFSTTKEGMIEFCKKEIKHGGYYGFTRLMQPFIKVGANVRQGVLDQIIKEFTEAMYYGTDAEFGEKSKPVRTANGDLVWLEVVRGTAWGGVGLVFQFAKKKQAESVSESHMPIKDMVAVGLPDLQPGDRIRTRKMSMFGTVEKVKDQSFGSPVVYFRVEDGRLMKTPLGNCVKINKPEDDIITDDIEIDEDLAMKETVSFGQSEFDLWQQYAHDEGYEVREAGNLPGSYASFDERGRKTGYFMNPHDLPNGDRNVGKMLITPVVDEGYTVTPGINRERYTDLSAEGLEGPFQMKNGKVLYYDKKAGQYYDRDTDMYVDYDDYQAMNEDMEDGDWGNTPFEAYGVKGMKNTPWRKIFKNGKQAAAWCEKFDAEIHGSRELDSDELARMQRPKASKDWKMNEDENLTELSRAALHRYMTAIDDELGTPKFEKKQRDQKKYQLAFNKSHLPDPKKVKVPATEGKAAKIEAMRKKIGELQEAVKAAKAKMGGKTLEETPIDQNVKPIPGQAQTPSQQAPAGTPTVAAQPGQPQAPTKPVEEQGVSEGFNGISVNIEPELDYDVVYVDINGKKYNFNYWYADETPTDELGFRKDIPHYLKREEWYNKLDFPTKMEVLHAVVQAELGNEPSEYQPTVGDEPLDEQGVNEGTNHRKESALRAKLPTNEGFTVTPGINRERYTDLSHEGLEGPFQMKNGKVLYYDKKAGQYYDRDTDMFVDYDDYQAMNEEQVEESTGTVYANAIVIKTKKGREVGEIYQKDGAWGCFHYRLDCGAEGMDSKEQAYEELEEMHTSYLQNKGNFGNVELKMNEAGEQIDEMPAHKKGTAGYHQTQARRWYKNQAIDGQANDETEKMDYHMGQHRKMTGKNPDFSKIDQGLSEDAEDGDWGNTPFEAYGIKGVKRTQWRKIFKNGKQAAAWCDKFDAEILGSRELDSDELSRIQRPKSSKDWKMNEEQFDDEDDFDSDFPLGIPGEDDFGEYDGESDFPLGFPDDDDDEISERDTNLVMKEHTTDSDFMKITLAEFRKLRCDKKYESEYGGSDEFDSGFGVVVGELDGQCVAVFYKDENIGSYNPSFYGDLYDFIDVDPHCPNKDIAEDGATNQLQQQPNQQGQQNQQPGQPISAQSAQPAQAAQPAQPAKAPVAPGQLPAEQMKQFLQALKEPGALDTAIRNIK